MACGTKRTIERLGLPESLEIATRGTRSINMLQSEAGIPAGDVWAGCYPICAHRCRRIGKQMVEVIPAANCGPQMNGVTLSTPWHSPAQR